MNKSILFLGMLVWCIGKSLFSQPFSIGHISNTFSDTLRNRPVDAEIYYPADMPGDNVPVKAGAYPAIIFGHGFVMTWSAYQNFTDLLVPLGYILVFPTTEGGLFPNHQLFAEDMAFLVREIQAASSDVNSPFFGAVAPKAALMGHSMGGGASVLAAGMDTLANAIVNFAAAETNPSAIMAAEDVSVPALIFSGSEDCVTPPGSNQLAIYHALPSPCKVHIGITGGGHCYFANNNFNCTLGESTCLPVVPISRSDQQSVVNDLLPLWLEATFNENPGALTSFRDSLTLSSRFSHLQSCNSTSAEWGAPFQVNIYPNPVGESLYIQIPGFPKAKRIEVWDVLSRRVISRRIEGFETRLHLAGYAKGPYFLKIDMGNGWITRKIILR